MPAPFVVRVFWCAVLLGQGSGKLLQSLRQHGPGAGDVEALVLAAGGAEDMAAVEPKLSPLGDEVIELPIAEAIGGEVEPEQVGALGFGQFDFGEFA